MNPGSDPRITVRHDPETGICKLVAVPLGPAGSVRLDVVPGLYVSVDRAVPSMLTEVWVGQNLRKERPAGAEDLVELLLGEPAASALVRDESTSVPFAPAATDRRAAVLATVAMSAVPDPSLAQAVRMLELAVGAATPEGHSAGITQQRIAPLDRLADRLAAVVAWRLRTLSRHDTNEISDLLSDLEPIRQVVRARLGTIDLGSAHQLPPPRGSSARDVWDTRPLTRSRALVAAPHPRHEPTPLRVTGMRLHPTLLGPDGDQLRGVTIEQGPDARRPFLVRATAMQPIPPQVSLWARVSAKDGTPLVQVVGASEPNRMSITFLLPAQLRADWGTTHIEILDDPVLPPMTVSESCRRAGQFLAVRAVQHDAADGRDEPAGRFWEEAASEYEAAGCFSLACMALEMAGASTRVFRRVLGLTARHEGAGAVAEVEQWSAARAASLGMRVPAPGAATLIAARLQPTLNDWVASRLRIPEQERLDGTESAQRIDGLLALADDSDTRVRLARAIARLRLASTAVDSGDADLAHRLMAVLLEDYSLLARDEDLRAQVARIRDLLWEDSDQGD